MIGKKQILGDLYDYYTGDVLPTGYIAITNIKEAIYAANHNQKDYKWIRKWLQQLDFNLLSNEDKLIVSQYRAASEENCKTILGDTYEYWSTDFGVKSKNCREFRFEMAKTILINNVSLQDRYNILGFLNTTQLEDNYIKHGIEGLNDGDPVVGFFDFVEATNDYASTGIATMTLTMLNNLTKEEMIMQIMECLKQGNY